MIQGAVSGNVQRPPFHGAKVTIGTGIKKRPVAFIAFFTHRKCNCAVRVAGFNGPDNINYFIVGKIPVFPALQYKGTKAQVIPCRTALQDLLLCQTVSFGILVTFSDAAVVAIVSAMVCKLYKPRIYVVL